MGKEKTKCEEEDNDVMARAPPTCNPSNVAKVGPRLKRLQRVWFGGGRKRMSFQYPAKTSFGRYSARKASLPKIGSRSIGTT